MDYRPLDLQKNKEKLPFAFPGQVEFQDFSEGKYKNSESRVFIRPSLFLLADLHPETERLALPRFPDCYLLFYVRKGSARIESEEESCDLTGGGGLLTRADMPLYLKHSDGDLNCLLLFLRGDLLAELYKVRGDSILCFRKYEYPDFEQRLHSLLVGYCGSEGPLLFDFSRHMDHLLSRMLLQSLHTSSVGARYKKQIVIHQVLTYMQAHCREDLSVEDIATAFGFSTSHFSRIFQAKVQESPKKYLIRLRIDQATKLLETSDHSIDAIAQECGFNTTTHFIQTFKSFHDITPLQYRKRKLQGLSASASSGKK